MSFNVNFYKTNDDPKVANKAIIAIKQASCRPTTTVDILNPVFEVDYDAALLKANYCYCALFGNRYYFINDIKVDIGKKIILYCSVDVLKTYYSQIKECKACITRSESIGEPTYVIDNKLPVNPSKKELKSALFEGGFTHSYSDGAWNMLIRMN